MNTMAELSDEQVADQITTWAGRIAAGEARLLGLIAEFDRREAWAGPGMLSCAHWLSWRVGMGLRAAHERVRVARALADLPVLAQAFAAGQLSWTQVRAITQVATDDDETSWLHWARHATGAQLERLVRGVRRAQRLAEDAADPQAAAWRDEARVSYDEDGTVVIRLRLSAADGALVVTALEQARAALDHQSARDASDSSAEDPPRPASSTAEGFVHLARVGLEAMASTRPAAARRHRSRLSAHIDPLVRLGAPDRWRTVAPRLAARPEDPGLAVSPAGGHRPHPLRPGPHPATAVAGAAGTAGQRGRAAMPLPGVHPAPQAARPPREVLVAQRCHGPGRGSGRRQLRFKSCNETVER